MICETASYKLCFFVNEHTFQLNIHSRVSAHKDDRKYELESHDKHTGCRRDGVIFKLSFDVILEASLSVRKPPFSVVNRLLSPLRNDHRHGCIHLGCHSSQTVVWRWKASRKFVFSKVTKDQLTTKNPVFPT